MLTAISINNPNVNAVLRQKVVKLARYATLPTFCSLNGLLEVTLQNSPPDASIYRVFKVNRYKLKHDNNKLVVNTFC